MKETEQESAALKRAFKDHFAAHGFSAPMPFDLKAEADAFPCEYCEACEEFTRDASIRCNECGWHGDESDLLRCDDASDGERADACPVCRTDHFLMDLDGTETPLRP